MSDPRSTVAGMDVVLVPWSEDDFWLLRRANSPEMTVHLGGPESEERLADRHRRYIAPGPGCMYRVASAETGEGMGTIGFWERDWRGGAVWETGWAVLPEFQGQGIAVAAARAVVGAARAVEGHRFLHAFPKVGNVASNGVCRRAGFRLLGAVELEYPEGNPITSNDWSVDLRPGGSGSAQ